MRTYASIWDLAEEFAAFSACLVFAGENGAIAFHKCFLHPISDGRRDI